MVLGWFLYPKAVFLAMMYEGSSNLYKSESYYLRYLEKNPLNKFATLRLAKLYYRLGQPNKSTKLLKDLSDYRYLDWDIAEAYLDHLKVMHDTENYYEALRQKADIFSRSRNSQPEIIRRLLDEALHYAVWLQKHKEAYDILEQLVDLGRNKNFYQYKKYNMDLASQDTSRITNILTSRLKTKPKDTATRYELIGIYMGTKKFPEALDVVNEGISLYPYDIALLRNRSKIYEKLEQYDKAAEDLQFIMSLMEKDEKPARDITKE